MTTQHTPTVLRTQDRVRDTYEIVDEYGRLVATIAGDTMREANDRRNYIVRACNAHAGLVETQQLLIDFIVASTPETEAGGALLDKARAVLALARGEG